MTDLAFGNWGAIGPDAAKAMVVEVCSATGAQLLANAIKADTSMIWDPIPNGLEIQYTIEKGDA